MSSSPGCPAHSNPSTLIASHPIVSALIACRTEVHLWMSLIPVALNPGMNRYGLFPAVSTIFTPDSTIACAYSS